MPDEKTPKINEKANHRAKEIGFYNLQELAKYSYTSRQTLNNWFNKNRPRFETITKGAMINKMEQTGYGKN